MKRLLLAAGGILIVGLAGSALYLRSLDVTALRGQIEQQLQDRLGRQVKLGSARVELFPFAIGVDQITIAESPDFATGRPFLTAAHVGIRVSPMEVLQGQTRLHGIRVDEPQVELVKDTDGVWNFSSLGSSSKPGGDPVRLDLLEIRGGRLAVTNSGAPKSRTEYHPIHLTLTNYNPGERFGLDLTIQPSGDTAQKVRLEGTGETAGSSFEGDLTLSAIQSSTLQQLAGRRADAAYRGSLDGKLKLATGSSAYGVTGALKASDLTIAGTKYGSPADLRFDLAAKADSSVIQIKSLELSTADHKATAQGTADISSTPPVLKLQVRSPRFTQSGVELANLDARILFRNNALTVGPFKADLYGGQINSSAVLQLASRRVTSSGKITGVDAEKFLGAVSAVRGMLSGELNLETGVSFVLDGRPPASTLNGTASIQLAKGRIQGLNVLRHVATVGKFLGLKFPDGEFTDATGLSASFQFRDGVGETNDLTAKLPAGQMTGGGTVNLNTQEVALRLSPTVDAALAGRALTVPLNVRGPWTALRVTPDAKALPAVIPAQIPGVKPQVDKIGEKLSEKLGDKLGDKVTDKLGDLLGRKKGKQ